MKKNLLLVSIASITFFAQAQDQKKISKLDLERLTKIDQNSTSVVVKKPTIPTNKSSSSVLLGTSHNIYSILSERQNQVVYNADINTVAFSHRQNATSTIGGANASGVISLDYSTDGGNTWTINPYATTPTGDTANGTVWNGNRYPSIAIYNPSGNTDKANAFMLETGSSLSNGAVSGNNGWAKSFATSFKLDNTLLDEQYVGNSISSVGNANEFGAGGLYVTSQGTAWYASTNTNNAGSTTAPNHALDVTDDKTKFFIVRGDFNTTTNKFEWSVADTIKQVWNKSYGQHDTINMAGVPNMAWSVDGNTGYMVTMASWGANTMYRPYVMKTTDAGTTWANVNDYDFSTNTVLQSYILETKANTKRPSFGPFDMVVGSDNELRIFTKINSASSAHPDSLLYSWTARETSNLFEVATNGTGWDVTFVDSIYVTDFEWDTQEKMKYYVRPQACRSQNGEKLIYTWLGSNTDISSERQIPEVWAVAHDISGTEPAAWSAYKILSEGTAEGTSPYQTVAVDAIENGTEEDWEVALVYANNGPGVELTSALDAPQWNFMKGAGFSASDFTTANGNAGGEGSHNFYTSVKENALVSENIKLFPNPSNGIVILQVAKTNEFDYTIIDVVGNIVQSNHVNGKATKIDLTNYAKGLYFVNINNGTNTITKKIILSK